MNVEQHAEEAFSSQQIDAALTTYPVAPLPPNFLDQVMAQVEATPQIQLANSQPTPLYRYLRLYGLELACATLLTLGLAVGIGWPLLAQAGLLPVPWAGVTMAHAPIVWLAPQHISSWYVFGFCGLVVLELVIALMVWLTWIEQPRLRT